MSYREKIIFYTFLSLIFAAIYWLSEDIVNAIGWFVFLFYIVGVLSEPFCTVKDNIKEHGLVKTIFKIIQYTCFFITFVLILISVPRFFRDRYRLNEPCLGILEDKEMCIFKREREYDRYRCGQYSDDICKAKAEKDYGDCSDQNRQELFRSCMSSKGYDNDI
jgi:hypothetical protein